MHLEPRSWSYWSSWSRPPDGPTGTRPPQRTRPPSTLTGSQSCWPGGHHRAAHLYAGVARIEMPVALAQLMGAFAALRAVCPFPTQNTFKRFGVSSR